jgi:hypothetical protein
MHLSRVWLWAWPYMHWMISVGFTVLAVEALYFLAPNVRQRFRATLPGAILSVLFWIGFSYLLGIYFRTFANFSKTYGTLGAGIALMVWLYWTGFAMLVGAELNAELAKRTKEGAIEQKEDPREADCLNSNRPRLLEMHVAPCAQRGTSSASDLLEFPVVLVCLSHHEMDYIDFRQTSRNPISQTLSSNGCCRSG